MHDQAISSLLKARVENAYMYCVLIGVRITLRAPIILDMQLGI